MEKLLTFIEKNSNYVEGVLIILIGFFVVQMTTKLYRMVTKNYREYGKIVIMEKIIKYLFNLTILILGLRHMGFDLKLLLGAAGVFTVAIGFASQTSASNLISGIFLLAERPFKNEDIIKVDEITGIVVDIDLLSTRLRTFDNVFIRIPNETLMKSKILNYTHYPIRRVDIKLQVDFDEDLKKVEGVLRHIAEENPDCLNEPEPLFMITDFADSGVAIQFSVWAMRDKFLDVRNAVYAQILEDFKRYQIAIPYPHQVMIRKDNL